jgi:Trk K+ transport system NAD-binding subunit
VPHAPALHRRFAAVLPSGDAPEPPAAPLEGHCVVVGMNTLGRTLVRRLSERGETVVAIDTDPTKLEGLPAHTVFGNADSTAVLRRAGLERARLVIAAPQIEDVNALIAYRCHRAGVPVSVHAFDPTLMDELLEIGADHLMMPKLDGIRLVEQRLHELGVLG